MHKISLNAFDKTYEIVGFKHSMFRDYESSGYCYPKSGLVGGFFQVEFASDADVSFLEKMVMIEWGERNFETLSDDDYVRMNCFSGKLSCHFNEAESGKVYEWKHAIVTYYEEIAHSLTGEPMKTRVVFSPFDLRVNNLLISRYSGKTEKGTWYFYEPEEEEQPKPASKPTVLVTKVDGKEEAQPNEKVTYKVVEFNQKDVTEDDKKRIHWVVKIGKEKVAEHLRHGEKLELTIKEEWAGKEIIVMPYLVKPNEKEVSKKTRVIQKEVLIIIGTEQSSENVANRLMFPAMAIRKLRTKYSNYPFIKILIFIDGYTERQLSIVEGSIFLHNRKAKIIRVNSIENVINIINTGNISAIENKEIRKITSIYIYSHGYIKSDNNEGIIAFGYQGKNANKQELDIEHFSKINKTIFLDNNKTHLYSYACRTGIGTSSEIVSNPNKDNSLAQKMADIGRITVFAYMKRSLYEDTWGTQRHRDTYASDNDTENSKWDNFKADMKDLFLLDPSDMENFSKYREKEIRIDGAIWNVNGAYLDVKAGEFPKGVPSSFNKYTPKQ